MPFWALACFFLFTMTAVTAACSVFLNRARSGAAANPGASTAPLDAPSLRPAQAAMHDLFRNIGRKLPAAHADGNPWRRRLAAAGYRWSSSVAVFYGLKMGLAIFVGLSFAIMGAAWGQAIPAVFFACLSGGALGWLIPDRLVMAKAAARARRLRSAIPAALDMMAMSLEAGQSLDLALLDGARALHATYRDLSDELYQARLELSASNSRVEALQRMATRTGELEIRRLSHLLIDADRFGTSLAPALRGHARMVRTRFRQQAQEQARKVGVKLIFPVFFLIFPSVLLVTLGPAVIMIIQQMRSFAGQ